MLETRTALTEPNSEESMSVSEASSSSGTLAMHSPVSDVLEPDTIHGFKQNQQIFDPLRFPLQNGEVEQISSHPPERSQVAISNHVTYINRATSHNNSASYSLPLSNKTVTSSASNSPLFSATSKLATDISTMTSQHSSIPATSKGENGFLSTSKIFNFTQLKLSLPDTHVYEPETVDFPSSPTTFRSPSKGLIEEGVVRLAEGEGEIPKPPVDEGEDDDKSLYTATACLPTGRVTLRKMERPKSLEVQRKRLTVTEELLNISVDEDQHSVSSLSYHNSEEEDEGEDEDDEEDDDDDAQMLSHDEFTDMLTPDDIDTPDELEESIMERLGPEFLVQPQPEPSTSTGARDEKSWRSVVLSGIERRIDMKVIEPYKKVLSHGGYMPGGNNDAIIVFSACFLPDRSRRDYNYVMDHLFMYVLTTLDQLVGEDYVLIYLHGATTRGNMPSFAWLKRCYQMIDRRLRKNLQGLYLVHPTFWVKTVVVMARPFVSSKFARKLRFIANLKELSNVIPLDQVCIPSRVKQYDEIREALLEKSE